ncbi:MAG: phosphate regulon sensor histidine kinase PhoR [Gammaproteobacteria bacterium RIFCSPLOWO2_02_FULL_61_13]|nr:MAG: phosphate regulon sensor histidine kinase PhoR [Gammaproteobacteria bacterium RIFCSPLOWO2_02_FULL_61_13]
MRLDLLRVLVCVTVFLVPGLYFGHPFLFITIGLVGLGIWYFRMLQQVVECVRHEADESLPDVPGVINELAREFQIARSHHTQWEAKLTDYLSRFRDAAAALPDAVIITDRSGRIKWANDRAQAYLGIEFPRDAGQRITNLVRHPLLTEALAIHETRAASRVLEMPSPQSEGQLLELRMAEYGDADTLFVARDVTELQRLNRMRRDFIANASHELRTPLTVIGGYLEAFEDDAALCPPDWGPKIQQMRGQALRMQRLIEDLLQLSSLESAGEQAFNEETPVGELLLAVQKEAQTLSGSSAHQITLEAEPGLWVNGSQRDLYSVVSNIVFNAVQYTPAGGGISMRWYSDDQGAHLAVCDQGEGIAAEHVPRLTERFYRVDKGRSRAYGGTGLGLAIVKHALARHDASLEIRSEPGKGSTFTCHFPATRIIRHAGPRRAAGPAAG